jgi:hypothetical protein
MMTATVIIEVTLHFFVVLLLMTLHCDWCAVTDFKLLFIDIGNDTAIIDDVVLI